MGASIEEILSVRQLKRLPLRAFHNPAILSYET